MRALHKRDKRRTGHDFIRQRIHQDAEVGDEFAGTRDATVQKVSDPGQAEKKQGQGVMKRNRGKQDPDKDRRQGEPSDRQFVW